MTKYNGYLLLWLAFVAVFVAPAAIYFMASLYGWLFLGGSIDPDRTIMALALTLMFGAAAAFAGAEL